MSTLFPNRHIAKINKELSEQMFAEGHTFFRGEKHEYFKDKEGNYASYPPGFIRGIGSTCMSVQGHNGWHQRTFQSIAAAEEWAVKTAREVLAEKSDLTAEPS